MQTLLVRLKQSMFEYIIKSRRVQTYIDVPPQVGERTPISAVYNPATREYILAAIKIAVVVLDEQLNAHHTDGFTHSRAVANILYNPLFKVVITCGMDSIIINWDPLTGAVISSSLALL